MERGNAGPTPLAFGVTASNLIGGRWVPIDGSAMCSVDPARPGRTVWSGVPSVADVGRGVDAARAAGPAWAAWPIERRAGVLRRFRALADARADALATLIRDEVGKPGWDALGEAQLLAAKIDLTLDPAGGLSRVMGYEVGVGPTRVGRCSFRPHGVMAVVGPFNFPMHLPSGHIAPALLMGNTVVFKPSDKAPACGQALAALYQEALGAQGAPPGVLNLVHGAGDVAAALVAHDGIDGVLFTGSFAVGRRILEANLDRPGRIVALEMGGNNAAIVMPDADLRQAAVECVRAAFITAGQRCTCTRRLIVHADVAARFIPAVCKAASALIVGDPAAAHPVFMGPMVSDRARAAVLAATARLARAGELLVQPAAGDAGTGGFYLAPGVVRVERFSRDDDEEVFGPLLQVAVVGSLDEALEQANATRFGLAASIFTRDGPATARFLAEARAGCLNVNTGTAGASGRLPFGGLGLSGNHRPAGAFSLDSCAYPVASLIETGAAAQETPGLTFDDRWL
ncbi:MAG: aldehyde dehydrogenase family protein [Phycisphaerae bacterium]|nr:aldehyde dehydrogenase family protein [Phycisphaerae bacterium]